MTGTELPDDLAQIERALELRQLPAPPARLRSRSLEAIERARSRAASMMLAAAAAVALAASIPWATTPEFDLGPAGERSLTEFGSMESEGLAGGGLRPSALALGASRVPRLAPPMGSAGNAGGGL